MKTKELERIVRKYEAALVTLSILRTSAPKSYQSIKTAMLENSHLTEEQRVPLIAMLDDVQEWTGALKR